MSLAADRRLSAADRREQVLSAAAEVFGRHGYTGTTTDRVARAAGISQPYVVRMFGSKEALFLEVLERARTALLAAFRAALAEHPGADAATVREALSRAYVDLVAEHGVHLPLMQAFLQGGDPVVGAAARAGFLDVWRLLREEAGLHEQEAAGFLGDGMLLNVLLGVGMPAAADADPAAAALVAAVCGPDLAFVLEHGR